MTSKLSLMENAHTSTDARTRFVGSWNKNVDQVLVLKDPPAWGPNLDMIMPSPNTAPHWSADSGGTPGTTLGPRTRAGQIACRVILLAEGFVFRVSEFRVWCLVLRSRVEQILPAASSSTFRV